MKELGLDGSNLSGLVNGAASGVGGVDLGTGKAPADAEALVADQRKTAPNKDDSQSAEG
jgi:hypothetical protein